MDKTFDAGLELQEDVTNEVFDVLDEVVEYDVILECNEVDPDEDAPNVLARAQAQGPPFGEYFERYREMIRL